MTPDPPSSASGLPGGAVPAPPSTVSAAAGLAGLEAAALAGYAVTYAVQVLPLGDNAMTRALIAGGVVLFVLLAAAGVGAAAVALLRLRHWPRSVLIVTQLLVLAIMVPLALAGWWLAWLAVAVAAAVTALVLAPATTAAIER